MKRGTGSIYCIYRCKNYTRPRFQSLVIGKSRVFRILKTQKFLINAKCLEVEFLSVVNGYKRLKSKANTKLINCDNDELMVEARSQALRGNDFVISRLPLSQVRPDNSAITSLTPASRFQTRNAAFFRLLALLSAYSALQVSLNVVILEHAKKMQEDAVHRG